MVEYDEVTRRAIERAASVEPAQRSRRDRTLLMLSGGQWVDGLDLALRASGLGYRSRISELRQSGVPIECRPTPGRPKGEHWHQYRLKPLER